MFNFVKVCSFCFKPFKFNKKNVNKFLKYYNFNLENRKQTKNE